MIVSFSGIDSAGKSTQIELLLQYCANHHIQVKKIWGKARGTPGVEFIKRVIRKDKRYSLEQRLQYRQDIYKSGWKRKLLLIGSIIDLLWYFGIYYRILSLLHSLVICDRYIWDTYVEIKTEFQVINLDKWYLWKLLTLISPKPHISFILTIPPEVSIQRDVQKHDLTVDSMELKMQKIDIYMDLIRQSKWNHVLDGLRPIHETHKIIMEVLKLEN